MVSIIVPVYNAENRLNRLMESLLNQTYRDYEIILIDDGSKDNSAEICKCYSEKNKNVRFITRENKGVSKTRNEGINLAEGQYIMFVDSDDYVSPVMLETMYNRMVQDNSDIVIAGITEVGNNIKRNRLPEINESIKLDDLGIVYPSVFKNFLLNSPCDKLFKKSFIKNGFPEDLSLGEDLLFCLSYIENIEKISFIKDSFYYYDCQENGLTNAYREDFIRVQERLYIESMAFIKKHNIGKEAEVDVSSIFVKFFFYGISDLYSLSGKKLFECRKELKEWIYNENLRCAAKEAKLVNLDKKVALNYLKKGQLDSLHLLFTVRKIMRNRKNNTNTDKKKKIIIEGMTSNRGGVETFIYNIYNAIKDEYQVDFLVVDETIPFEDEFLADGCQIHRVVRRNENPLGNRIETEKVFKKGNYDVFWFNKTSLSNIESLKAAKKYGVKKIICHAHQSKNMGSAFTAVMHRINSKFIDNIVTNKAACSQSAADYFYGNSAQNVKIFNNAVEVDRFIPSKELRRAMRNSLGIAEDEIAVCLVARFREEKNHEFLLEIFKKLTEKTNAKLVLCGAGELEEDIKVKAKQLKISDRVLFLGIRKDIPEIMQAADVFVMPSLYEGLPFVLVEAQAAGVPCIVSDTVSCECKLTNLVTFESLKKDPEIWANRILSVKKDEKYSPIEELEEKGFTENALKKEIIKTLEV